MKIYTDINGQTLSHGDKIITIELNGKAVGGNLVEAYFLIDSVSNKAYLGKSIHTDNSSTNRSWSRFYKQNFQDKVYKISGGN